MPHWLGLVLSVALLLAGGVVGVQMNSAALRTAEDVHRADTATLVKNNSTLSGQYMLLSAKELADFARGRPLTFVPGDPGDRRVLDDLVANSTFSRYGAALTDLSGRVLNASGGGIGLPPADHPSLGPLKAALLAGRPGFSDVLDVGRAQLTGVGVPVMVDSVPRAVLIGFSELRASQLQAYVFKLRSTKTLTLHDAAGRVTAASDPALLGTQAPPAVMAAIRRGGTTEPDFVEYTAADGERVIASVVTNEHGWAHALTLSVEQFYGPVRTRSTQTNLALFGLLLVAVASLMVLAHRAQLSRRRSQERFQALVQNATDVITVLDRTGRIVWDSPSTSRVLGYPPGSRVGMRSSTTLHPDDRDEIETVFADLLTAAPGAIARFQARVLHLDDRVLWMDLSIANLLDNPAIRGIVVNARDVTDSRALQERLSYQALHDTLTGLPNRRLCQQRLREILGPGGDRAVAVLFVDLDRFKAVNDRHGHDAGDELLRQVAGRISACVRGRDTVARVGGDEFLVLLDGVAGAEEAEYVAARIVEDVRRPVPVLDVTVDVGASVGVRLGRPGEDAEEVLRDADAAMYAAKRAGGGYLWAGGERPAAGAVAG